MSRIARKPEYLLAGYREIDCFPLILNHGTPMASLLRNFLLGRAHIPSRKDYKFAMLRGQFALIISFVGLMYIYLDYSIGVHVFYAYYAALTLLGLVTIWLNRQGFYRVATVFMVVMVNGLVFIFADSDHPYGGVFLYFIPCALIGLILFGYNERAWGLAFCALTFVLALLAFHFDFQLVPPPVYLEDTFRAAFRINLVVSMSVSSFVVYFLLKRNHESESSLLASEQQLLEVTRGLKKSEERFQLAVEGTRAGIYEWRFQTQEIFVSATYKNLLGYAENELQDLSVQKYLREMIHPADAERMHLNMDDPGHLSSPYQTELRLKTKDGRYKWFLDSGVVQVDAYHQVQMIVGSIIDIDERKKAEEEINLKNRQLAKTNEELDRFVYSASHDMRAPLASLLGLIHLSEKTHAPEELHLYMGMMKERIKTMEGFIKEVTDYSRNTRLSLTVTEVAVRPLLEEIARNLAYAVDQRKVTLRYEVEPSLKVITDVNRLRVVLNNLVSNAYKYHDAAKGERFIRLSGFRQEKTVFITVEDNGLGIEAEHLHRVFDMFYRASVKSEGSGLGLYIVKETLQKLGGDISVTSRVGEGTAFTFSVPDQPLA